jgi:hypothetical protein
MIADAPQVRSGFGVQVCITTIPPVPPPPVTPALPIVPALPFVPAPPIAPAVPVGRELEPPQFEAKTTNESPPPIATNAENRITFVMIFRMLVRPFVLPSLAGF